MDFNKINLLWLVFLYVSGKIFIQQLQFSIGFLKHCVGPLENKGLTNIAHASHGESRRTPGHTRHGALSGTCNRDCGTK